MIHSISTAILLDRVQQQKCAGARLVQISATRFPDRFEVIYSFDSASELSHLRVSLPVEDPRLPSISGVYECAVLYENEMHDLFDIQVSGMAVDFSGNFYKTAVSFPFGRTVVPVIKPGVSGSAPDSGGRSTAVPLPRR